MKKFFSKTDWAAFWTATATSFVVYFLTLAPSVTLEDSGELAVAGDHLGVPHPPGYPTWTMIVWCFARLFSWVTFRGQPTPAWSIALASGVCGALAAGFTAMLISHSAADMLEGLREKRTDMDGRNALSRVACWISGVAGSLIFAFSPVMWSQSTIVEVYALGAFFMMLVMLLTYRWMRQPEDKTLWLTAFVFGLGLTNYQVLLLAALPLVIILFLRNIAMFRDFLITAIPFGLGALALWIGSMPSQPGIEKQTPLAGEIMLPSNALVVASLVVFGLALAMALAHAVRGGKCSLCKGHGLKIVGGAFGLAAFLMLLSALAAHKGVIDNPDGVTLIPPVKYVVIGMFLLVSAGIAAVAAAFRDELGNLKRHLLVGSIVAGAIAVVICATIAAPTPLVANDPEFAPFQFGKYAALFFIAAALVIALSATVKDGVFFTVPVVAAEMAAFVLLSRGAFMGLTHPTTWWFWTPICFNFMILALSAIVLPCGRSVAMTVFAAELGVSFYAYMPIVSDLRNPPMNWGYPRTWEGFKHAITRGQYEKLAPTDIFSPRFIQQIGGYFSDLRTQFTLLVAPFGFLAFSLWAPRRRDAAIKPAFLTAAIALAAAGFVLWGIDSWVAASAISDSAASFLMVAAFLLVIASVPVAIYAGIRPLQISLAFIGLTIVFVVLGNIPAVERAFDASRIDKLSLAGLMATCAVGGLALAFDQLKSAAKRALSSSEDRSEMVTTALVLLGVVGAAFLFLFKETQTVVVYARALGMNMPADKIVSSWADVSAMLSGGATAISLVIALAILAAAFIALNQMNKKGISTSSLDNVSQQWIIGTVANFLVMSFLLIVLANPKGDLQDTFIQKVKFISSHGLFALWIGYGLLFAIYAVREIFSGADRRVAKAVCIAAVAAVALTPLIPIRENYCNDQLVFELGGAEQNGHDYGWQFGNYELRGADAITEELEADEEPLPNPLYPLEMEPDSIFFGGTDPGRFVPTYMIYSANVRPDVFLITQNALADNTFMSVTRDLYANQIWIPTPEESSSAFQVYVEEVKNGTRPKNADLIIQNGRVQVVGALGVMEINGILCKMLHDHNKAEHSFFVEESYAIPWMYPYLTPNGLILRLNAEKLTIPRRNVTDDLDFWDWYTRRLTRDDKYRRDIVAQKSFSKLRSAIAGLYSARGLLGESERAFVESRILYPVSPEANFRYIQEILMRQSRIEDSIDVVSRFCELDQKNERGQYFRSYLLDLQMRTARATAIIGRKSAGEQVPTKDLLQAGEDLCEIGSVARAKAILKPLATASDISVGDAYRLATLLGECGDNAAAVVALDRVASTPYVTKSPDNALGAVKIYVNAGILDKAMKAMKAYMAMNPSDWKAWVDYASLAVSAHDVATASKALEKAITIGREGALAEIERNPGLMMLVNQVIDQMRRRQSGQAPFAPAPPAPYGM